MMKINKENWEYKKLGDICEILDSRRKPVTKEKREKGEYPYYGSTGIQDYVSSYLFDGRFLLLGEDGGKWGKYERSSFIAEGKIWVNNHTHILKFSKDLLYEFVMYYLNYKDLSAYITGAVVPKLTQANMRSIMLPIPSLKEQDYITNLFDRVTNLITLKQKQLKEFDSLESSVFIKMFGDSVVKEMGWDVKSLGEIGNIITGSTPSTKDKENYEPKEYCFVKPSDLPSKGVANITTTEYFVSSKGFALSRALPIGSVLISCIGTIGKIGILKQVACSNQQINAIIPNRTIDSYYLAYNIAVNKNKLESMANAPVVPIINKTSFSLFKIAIPPLTLQQSFAQKIEVIEKQKEVVKNEIAQLQALLDSEMDKYFG
jgi:type I restriction enzyme S subunit